jgi:hypothetical protein
MDNNIEATTNPRYFRRREASAYLREKWAMRCAEQTLARYAVEGCGPPFRRFGRDIVYEKSALDAWARSRLSGPIRSTSEQLAT